MSREAMQMALEALEWIADNHEILSGEFTNEITALRAALAEPETFMHEYKHQAYGYHKEDGALKLGTMPDPNQWREFASDYERGVIDGMSKQAERSVDRAVNAMSRKPLTEEKMKELWYAMKNIMGWYSFQEVARAIETAHGIGEQP